jgi:hypothetical protein
VVSRVAGGDFVVERGEHGHLVAFSAAHEVAAAAGATAAVELRQPVEESLALLGGVPVGQHLVDEGGHVGAGEDPLRGRGHGARISRRERTERRVLGAHTPMHVATKGEQIRGCEGVQAVEPRGRHQPLD